MALDIFSSFDDHNKVIFNFYFLMWATVVMLSMVPLRKMWAKNSIKFSSVTLVMSVSKDLISRTKMKDMAGSMALIMTIIMFVAQINAYGLSPYSFSVSSHIAANLSIALPLWMGSLLASLSFDLPQSAAHLLPLGAPWYLAPFLCVIELSSLMVRPFTLAVRLTANLSTGHILMALLGMGITSSTPWMVPIMMFLGIFYCLFELAVCIVQAYIFGLLPTLYADEHPEALINNNPN